MKKNLNVLIALVFGLSYSSAVFAGARLPKEAQNNSHQSSTENFDIERVLHSKIEMVKSARDDAKRTIQDIYWDYHQGKIFQQVFDKENISNRLAAKAWHRELKRQTLESRQESENDLMSTYDEGYSIKKLNNDALGEIASFLDLESLNYLSRTFTHFHPASKNLLEQLKKEFLLDKFLEGKVSLGNAHTCAVENGTVRCWGYDRSGQALQQAIVPEDLEPVQSVAAGSAHTCALLRNGEVKCWGDGRYGQVTVPTDLMPAQSIAAGGAFTCALLANGAVQCWGYNGHGETDVPADAWPVKSITAGVSHTCALLWNGTVRCWGANLERQINVPAGVESVKSIAAGALHTCAVLRNSAVICWGFNASGQIIIPKDIEPVKSIAAGGSHTCALLKNGTVRCWGFNASGQRNVPTDLEFVQSIAAGRQHTCATLRSGKVSCWGYKSNGQITVPEGLRIFNPKNLNMF